MMKKKEYIVPLMEIAPIETGKIMDTSMTFLPPQPVRRRLTDVF